MPSSTLLLLMILGSLAMMSSSSSFTPSSSSRTNLVSRHGKKLLGPVRRSSSSVVFQLSGGSDNEEEEHDDEPTPPQSKAPPKAGDVEQQEITSAIPSTPPPPVTPTPAVTALPTATSTSTAKTPNLGPNAKTPPGLLRSKFPTLPWHKLPDYLTYMRCIAIPGLMAAFYTPGKHVLVGSLFAAASFTDWLDGYLARRWDISTSFGAFLDPVADKIMVCVALVLLSGRYGAQVAIPTCIILARELAVSALREWMAQRGQRDAVKVGMQGKVKTALTMVALTLLLFVPDNGEGWMVNLFLPGLVSLYVCAAITVTSGSVYFRAAAPVLLEKNN